MSSIGYSIVCTSTNKPPPYPENETHFCRQSLIKHPITEGIYIQCAVPEIRKLKPYIKLIYQHSAAW